MTATEGRRRAAASLAAGSAVNGLLAYVVFALTTRALGPDGAAPVSVLWSYWGFASAAFTFPVQHWIAHTVEAHGDGAVHRALPRLLGVVVAAGLLLGVLAWLGRESLFHRDDLWLPVMVSLVTLGSALTGAVRGGLSARHRFGAVALSLAAENGVRCAAVLVLVLADVRSVVAYGLCLVAGHLVAALWPSALRFAAGQGATNDARPVAFLAGAGLAQVINQSVLTGGPVVLALAGGSPGDVTALFAALALFRAPYMLGLGLVSQLTTHVTRLATSGETATLRRMRELLAGATVIAVGLAGGVAALVGPDLLRLVFGGGLEISRGLAALVAMGCTTAVANLVLTVTAMAQDRATAVARAWVLASLGAAGGFFALSRLDPVEQTVWCFLGAEVAAFVALLVVDARRGGGAAAGPVS